MKNNTNKKRKTALKKNVISAYLAIFVLAASGIIYLTTYFQKWIAALLTDDSSEHFFDFD